MISIPSVTNIEDAWDLGHKLSEEISGTPEVLDSDGNVIKPAVKGIFPPPLRMELENVFVNFLGIAKKNTHHLKQILKQRN